MKITEREPASKEKLRKNKKVLSPQCHSPSCSYYSQSVFGILDRRDLFMGYFKTIIKPIMMVKTGHTICSVTSKNYSSTTICYNSMATGTQG